MSGFPLSQGRRWERSATRVQALYRKELRDYRHNGYILATMAAIPLGILVVPLILVLALPASALFNREQLITATR